VNCCMGPWTLTYPFKCPGDGKWTLRHRFEDNGKMDQMYHKEMGWECVHYFNLDLKREK